jgi:hypothetical protein
VISCIVDPRFGFYEDITMASDGKLWKAVATIGLRRPPRSAVLFQKSSPMRVFSYSSCSHMPPTIETLLLLSERFRKSIDWILRGEGN